MYRHCFDMRLASWGSTSTDKHMAAGHKAVENAEGESYAAHILQRPTMGKSSAPCTSERARQGVICALSAAPAGASAGVCGGRCSRQRAC